jgi:hypothetical protein
MSTQSAIREAIDQARFIVQGYLGDLSDADLLRRPCPGANHINWQLGHLIHSEHWMMEKVRPGSMPPLPLGFAERYSRDTAASDRPSDFLSKTELLAAFEAQRVGTLKLLDSTAEEDFPRATGIDYAPTVQSLFLMQSIHWLMHAGQWAVVRRQLGRSPLF